MFSEKMGGGGSGSALSSQGGITSGDNNEGFRGFFNYGESDHWKYQCKWLDYPCVYPGFKLTMVVRKSGQEHSMGKRFLRCKGSPISSSGFKWFDELEKQKEENGHHCCEAGCETPPVQDA
ncbi:hypothetical protein IFM89_013693 [Coptis chinensis]|uniref:Zinc finger GRF-type domain-containing protein n=1 Tax=Coptis chinensis TaxID=261450 RepID=A0A835GXD4_9MAGN|nr:hypothetical protein IFM89_013693 [Coptis chinensis]